MPSWVILLLGVFVLGTLVFVVKRWGKMSTENKVLKRNLEAARTRKAIDHEVEKLTDDELADRLRGGM